MAITIKKVSSKKELKQFIRFNYQLYKDNPYSVPDLYSDMLHTFDRSKNAAFEFCEAEYFLALREGKIVGRIAGIINRRANEIWDKQAVRFGWIDFIDDPEVSSSLLRSVEEWGQSRGMKYIQGPLGFTDFDAEGMLIEGFDQLSTMATIYNHPYYPRHMERLGFEKDADWVEYKLTVPAELPEKHRRIAELIQQKYHLRIKKYTSTKQLAAAYGQELFQLINETYQSLYGFSPLSPKQIEQYIKMYLPVISAQMISLVIDEQDKLVAVGLSMPSISRALQKAKGKLFPFGWYHLLKALYFQRNVLDLLLIAVKPEYQNKGVNALLFCDLIPICIKMGFVAGESNPELELNEKVQAQWSYFESKQHKRRRAYIKTISG
jgi:GNAT superfamily N-acetyltransferase